MNKKRISLIVAAGVLVTALVGGSLAWFTDSSSSTNKFATGAISHEIIEKFEAEGPSQDLLPGDEVNKDEWIQSTAKSDALLRVKVTANLGEGADAIKLGSDVLELVFAEGVQEVLGENGIDKASKWVKGNDGYFYYTDILVGAKDKEIVPSEKLLDAVRLSGSIEDQTIYAGKKIDVIINSETVQVNKDAYRESWEIIEEVKSDAPVSLEKDITDMLDTLVDKYKVSNNKNHVEKAAE